MPHGFSELFLRGSILSLCVEIFGDIPLFFEIQTRLYHIFSVLSNLHLHIAFDSQDISIYGIHREVRHYIPKKSGISQTKKSLHSKSPPRRAG